MDIKEKTCQLSHSKFGPRPCLRTRIRDELGTTLEGIWYDFGLRGLGVGERNEWVLKNVYFVWKVLYLC